MRTKGMVRPTNTPAVVQRRSLNSSAKILSCLMPTFPPKRAIAANETFRTIRKRPAAPHRSPKTATATNKAKGQRPWAACAPKKPSTSSLGSSNGTPNSCKKVNKKRAAIPYWSNSAKIAPPNPSIVLIINKTRCLLHRTATHVSHVWRSVQCLEIGSPNIDKAGVLYILQGKRAPPPVERGRWLCVLFEKLKRNFCRFFRAQKRCHVPDVGKEVRATDAFGQKLHDARR